MEIVKYIVLLIISPRVGWEEVNRASIPTGKLMSGVFLPLLAILSISTFVSMLYDKTVTLSDTLMKAVIEFSSYYVTYFISSYLLSGFYPDLVKTNAGADRLNDFILFNLIFLVLLAIIGNILPIDFTPIFFLMLYMPWIAYCGVEHLGVRPGKVSKFVTIASVLILLTPRLVNYLLSIVANV